MLRVMQFLSRIEEGENLGGFWRGRLPEVGCCLCGFMAVLEGLGLLEVPCPFFLSVVLEFVIKQNASVSETVGCEFL